MKAYYFILKYIYMLQRAEHKTSSHEKVVWLPKCKLKLYILPDECKRIQTLTHIYRYEQAHCAVMDRNAGTAQATR